MNGGNLKITQERRVLDERLRLKDSSDMRGHIMLRLSYIDHSMVIILFIVH